MSYKIKEAKLNAKGIKCALIASRFNSIITNRLIEGAMDTLIRHDADEKDIDIYKVPGSFEIPVFALKLAQSKKYDTIICLSAIIRGETPHFDYVAQETTKGIAEVNLKTELPVIYGVITADSMEQAIDRAGGKSGNKGADAAMTAIEMVNLLKDIKKK
ncbi:MAG: 6,7-dimethyl-8-ribityllumazine synthase [Spirochaetes bacterium]|nr:6,7-dimethyl-8-ribityllumazine synthase [Spirochaetota bacterium]